MMHESAELIPVLTTQAGSALTAADWLSAGVKTGAVYLDALLMKPGISVLSQVSSIASYLGWKTQVVINASNLKQGNQGYYAVRSPFDGHIERFTLDAILSLINQLKPDMVILPRGVFAYASQILSKAIRIVIPYQDLIQTEAVAAPFGLVMEYHAQTDWSDLLAMRAVYPDLACYVVAHDWSLSLLNTLKEANVQWVESDKPAEDGMNGIIYDIQENRFSIQAQDMTMAFEPLEKECSCVACKDDLTRAYFHHLYVQTPGLCQRFLIQHNVTHCTAL
jgi:queuine tRNA-ribosyltransferase